MKIYLIIYIGCIFVIVFLLFIRIIRQWHINEYRKNYVGIGNGCGNLKYIPKKIFQILIDDRNNIAPEFIENIKFIRNLNPDWTYTLYNEKDIIEYIQKNYGDNILSYYLRINPKYAAARADFFRYLLLYKEGGVYLDIKSAIKFPLNDVLLFDDEYILSNWDFPQQFLHLDNYYRGEFQQWFIICRPNHPFLKEVIERVMKNIDTYNEDEIGVGKDAVLKVTGPIPYTKAILSIKDKYKYRLIDFNEQAGIIYNNLNKSHENLYSKPYYGTINEPVILKNF